MKSKKRHPVRIDVTTETVVQVMQRACDRRYTPTNETITEVQTGEDNHNALSADCGHLPGRYQYSTAYIRAKPSPAWSNRILHEILCVAQTRVRRSDLYKPNQERPNTRFFQANLYRPCPSALPRVSVWNVKD